MLTPTSRLYCVFEGNVGCTFVPVLVLDVSIHLRGCLHHQYGEVLIYGTGCSRFPSSSYSGSFLREQSGF
jgi:hypothetical protein